MLQAFKINLQNQFYSIKEGLILLALTPVGLAAAQLIGKISWDDYPAVLVIFLLYNLVLFLPAFYLHITYYIANNKTILTVDDYSKSISITEHAEVTTFKLDDIHVVEQNLGIYYKNKIDNRGRWITSWTNYGYLKLKLKNGKTFFLSSLMLNLLNPPLTITHTKYRFIPYFEKQDISIEEKRKWLENNTQEKVKSYMDKFADLSIETLQEKINNPSKYEPEAIIASTKLLKLKSNSSSSNKQ